MQVFAPSRPWSGVRRRPASASAVPRNRSPPPTGLDADQTQRDMTVAIAQEAAAVPARPRTAGSRRSRPASAQTDRSTRPAPGWVDRLSRRGEIFAPTPARRPEPAPAGPTATRARIRALSRNKMQGGALPPHRMLPPLEMPQPPPKTVATLARLATLAQKLDKNAHARNHFAQVRPSHTDAARPPARDLC